MIFPKPRGRWEFARAGKPRPAVTKADRSDDGIVHLNARMVIVIPVGMHFRGWAHKPTEQIEIVRSLTYHDPTSLALPGSAPWIRKVVGRFTPAEHSYDREHWFTQFAGIDSILHSLHRFVPTALADYSQFDSRASGGCKRTIARSKVDG